jgi:hypothetical protein
LYWNWGQEKEQLIDDNDWKHTYMHGMLISIEQETFTPLLKQHGHLNSYNVRSLRTLPYFDDVRGFRCCGECSANAGKKSGHPDELSIAQFLVIFLSAALKAANRFVGCF